jgi:hypothetical protein
LQSFPRLAEAAREPKTTARPDVVKASEGHFPNKDIARNNVPQCASLFKQDNILSTKNNRKYVPIPFHLLCFGVHWLPFLFMSRLDFLGFLL